MRNSGHNHGSGVRRCCHLIQQPEGEKKNETIHIKYLKSFYIITEHNIRNSPLTFFSLQFEPWWVDGFSNCRSAAWFLIGFLVQQLSPVSDARCSHMKQKGSLKGHLERTLPQPKPSSHKHFLCRALELAILTWLALNSQRPVSSGIKGIHPHALLEVVPLTCFWAHRGLYSGVKGTTLLEYMF